MILTTLFEYIATDSFTIGYSLAIVGLASVFAGRLFLRSGSLRKEIEGARQALSRLAHPDGSATEGIDEVSVTLSELTTLGKPWVRYVRGLYESPVHHAGRTHATSWRSSAPAATYFHVGSLIHPRLATGGWAALPNILTGLGILGTFLGLAAGIYLSKLGEQSASAEGLRASIGHLLDGASLAFTTSIFGLGSSLAFTGLHRLLLRRLDETINSFVATADECFPPVTAEQLAYLQLNTQREQAALLKQFNTELATQIGEALTNHLKPGLDSIDQRLQRIHEDQGRASDEVIVNVVDQFQSALVGAAGAEMKGMAETLATLEKTLASATQTFVQATGAWEAALAKTGESVERLESFSDALATLHGSLRGTLQQAIGCVVSAGKMLEGFGTVSAGVQAAIVRLESNVSNLSTINERTAEQWASYVDRFDETDEKLANTFTRLHEAWMAYGDEIQDYLRKLDDHTGDSLDTMGEAVRQLREALDELPDRVRDLEQVLRTQEAA